MVLFYFKKLNWTLLISAVLLSVIGLLSIYSSSLAKGDFLNFKKQILFFAVSIFLMVAVSFLDWRIFRENPYLILILYFICVIALVGIFFFAPEIRGVKGWYRIWFFAFDPREFTKIVLIILLAKYFSIRHVEMYRLRHILLSGFYTLLPTLLIFKQPDLGSAAMLIFVWVGVLIISGIKLKHFLILVFCGILAVMLGWFFFLKEYQKERIVSFVSPEIDPLGLSWSQTQSKIAVGSGGLIGQGFGKGSQIQHGFLPEPETDFIFSALAEEFGLAGVAVIFSLFIILLWQTMRIAFNSKTNFTRLFAAGFGILIISQIFIHVGMNLGILPVIGITLPLVSYGGSSLIAIYIGLGILQSFKIRQ